MDRFPCVNVIKKDIERCLVVLDLEDNAMESPCALYFLDRRNNVVVDEILKSTKLPKTITKVKLKVLPTEIGKFYYSFNGIETIIFNLLKNDIKPFDRDIRNSKCYLKVYYEKDEFYSIPVINLEITFFKKLHPKTVDRFYHKMSSEMVLFTSQVGDVVIVDVKDKDDFAEHMHIPLLAGCPEFKNEGLFVRKNFTSEQLAEMNHMHGIPPLKLEMDKVVNNRFHSLFDEIREVIDYSPKNTEPTESELNQIINTMFSSSEEDDLPF